MNAIGNFHRSVYMTAKIKFQKRFVISYYFFVSRHLRGIIPLRQWEKMLTTILPAKNIEPSASCSWLGLWRTRINCPTLERFWGFSFWNSETSCSTSRRARLSGTSWPLRRNSICCLCIPEKLRLLYRCPWTRTSLSNLRSRCVYKVLVDRPRNCWRCTTCIYRIPSNNYVVISFTRNSVNWNLECIEARLQPR